MTMVRFKAFSLLVLGIGFIYGCGTSAPATMPAPPPTILASNVLFVPAGVDSSVAQLADSLGRDAFVSFEVEEEARRLKEEGLAFVEESDSLWKYLEMTEADEHEVTREDSSLSNVAFNEGATAFMELNQINQDAASSSEEVNVDSLRARQIELLNLAQQKFEESIVLNPFEQSTRVALARVYQLQAARLNQEGAVQQSIDVLERLVRIQKGEYVLHFMLGENYFKQEVWESASVNFAQAETALLEVKELDLSAPEGGVLTAQDSTQLYNASFYVGLSQTKLYDASQALGAFERAAIWAPLSNQEEFAQSQITWINWDDGNIRGSETRDELSALVQSGDLAAAELGYNQMIPTLRTQRAIDESEWSLALVEASLDKTDSAANRLKALVDRTPQNADGTPEDSTYTRYFDDYGTICFNLAGHYFKDKRDKRGALTYFLQSASIPWKNQGVAYLEAAKILQANRPQAIAYAELGLEANPADATRKDLYQLLVSLYRASGNLDQARLYAGLFRSMQ